MRIKEMLGRTWRRWAWGLAVLLILVFMGVRSAVKARTSQDGLFAANQPTFAVQQGPLVISVDVPGTIKASEQEILKCEVEGQTTILSIVPEGNLVKKGDLLVELDSSKLQDAKVDQDIRVQNAQAAQTNASEKFEVTKNQAESDVDKAKLAYRFAQEDLKNYIEGEYPMNLKEVEAKITLAESTLKRAQNELDGSNRLFARNFITATELEADKQAALKADLDLQLAKDEKELLNDFTYTRKLAELESDVNQTKMALERAERKATADVTQADADLKAKQAEAGQQENKLTKTQEQIVKTKMYAPADGLVVYATTGQRGGPGRNVQPLAEGQSVRERQELIYLPTASSYMAEVNVHETSLAKIALGLPVDITVDALPGKSFTGRVKSVAPLPDAQSAWMNPDLKVYNTDIDLEGDTEGLRTGMSCLAKIIVQEYDDATYIPVQAVVRSGGEPTVYVVNGGKVEPRKIELGLDNNRMARIVNGLSPGEQVLLVPPLNEKEDTPELLRARSEARKEETKTDQPQMAAGPEGSDGAMAPPDGEAMRDRFMNASPEEREKMRQQFEERLKNMSPEERGKMTGPLPPPPEGLADKGPDAVAQPDGAAPGGGGSEEMRQRRMNASPEEREKMRKQFEERLKNMTPEEREKMQARFRPRQQESTESEP